jgi:predicted RND superfamily exporter protein
MQSLANTIIKFRGIIILLVFILTIFLGYHIKNLSINSDVISSLPEDDPYATLLKKVGEQFGGNKIGMVILETEDVFSYEVLARVKQITDTLKLMQGISSVTSLTNIISISSGEDGLEVANLVDEYDLPDSQEEYQELKKKVFSKDLYKGSIVSEDGTATVIIFTLLSGAEVENISREVIRKTRAMGLPENLYFAGAPMMVTAVSNVISADLYKLIPIAFVVIALTLFLGFRSKRGVIMPLLTAAIAIIWTMGTMSLMGFQLTMVTNNMPIILLAVGSAYTIHVVNRIAQVKDTDKRKILVSALTYIFIPVVLAAVTTMIGFISFTLGSYLEMIRDFGLFTAIGTLFSVVLSLFFVPAVIYNLRIKHDGLVYEAVVLKKSYLSERYLGPLKNLLFRHPKYILTTWSILILISIISIFFIKRSVNVKEYFKRGNPARVAEEIMADKFGGSSPIFVLFEGDIQSPEVLNNMVLCEEYMRESPDILTTQSVAGLVLDLAEGFDLGRDIPADKSIIQQLWFMIDGNEMVERFVNEDLDEGVIISKFISPDNKAKKDFARYMEQFVKEYSTETCKISFTGMPFIDVTMDKSLLRSQMMSLSIAVIFAIIIVGLILRSFLKGIFATVPMIAAIIILFGVMGITGIPLNIATVLVASVALGIGIDYSIHVISNFTYWIENGQDIHHAIEDTILISGKAILINVSSVTAGFLVLLFSEMLPLQYFGLLIGLSMIASSQAAMTLLPVMLILINRRYPFKSKSKKNS